MKIEKFLPCAALAPLVREFIVIESDLERSNTLLPDTTIVLAFRLKGTVLKIEEGEKETLPVSAITGLWKSSRILHYAPNTANLLVVLKEGGLTAFSRMPAQQLFSLSISADNIFPSTEMRDLAEQLTAAPTHTHSISLIETFLLQKLIAYKTDLLIDQAIHNINQQNGVLRIKDLANSLHISQDAFEKRFRAYVGTTPKQYASTIRIKHLLAHYPSYSSLTEATYEAGYFDQSHFIKDFRQFTGKTPKAFFQSSLYW